MDLFQFTMQQLAPPVAPTCAEVSLTTRHFLTNWLRRRFYLAPGQSLRPALRLVEDLDLSALARLELVGDLETYYEVQISDQAIAGLVTVLDVESYLCRHRPQAA